MRKVLSLFLSIIFVASCGSGEESFEPKVLSDCDRTYYETTRTAKDNKSTVTWTMSSDKYFSNCSPGNKGVWSNACPYYQKCVSEVKYLDSGKSDNEFVELDFERTAKFIKSKLWASGKTTERKEKCRGNRCWMTTPNITAACDAVSSTYSGKVVGNSIFENIPEFSYEKSHELGQKAVKGYGECLCILHNALNIQDDYSIGYCIGERYIECDKKAFCGREIKR